MKKVPENAKYLGAPLFSTKSRSKDFKFLQEKLESYLNRWRSKSLFWAGRGTFIKLIAKALPTYTFSTFNVPSIVCGKLDATTHRYQWSPNKDKGRFLAWKSWEHLCKPKKDLGLGFRKAKKVNEGLIAKLTWMVVSKRVSSCMEALRSKYKVTESWLKEAPRKYASNTWRAVERMKSLIVKGACFLVGDGLSIDIWKEPWVPWLLEFTPKPTAHSNNTQPMIVAELIDPICRCQNETKLNELFDATSISTIKRISIPTTLMKDKLVWILEPKGNYSVKLGEAVKGWKDLWKLKIHERLKMQIWRIANGILPTRITVAKKLGFGETLSPFCHDCEELVDQLFFKCHVSRALVWNKLGNTFL